MSSTALAGVSAAGGLPRKSLFQRLQKPIERVVFLRVLVAPAETAPQLAPNGFFFGGLLLLADLLGQVLYRGLADLDGERLGFTACWRGGVEVYRGGLRSGSGGVAVHAMAGQHGRDSAGVARQALDRRTAVEHAIGTAGDS